MTKLACQYAIVRFMPYVETGEFANVGVVLWAPKSRHLEFKLLRRRYGRITQFFEELDRKVYLNLMHDFEVELIRIQDFLDKRLEEVNNSKLEYGFHKGIFQELIRPRETIIRFSEPRTVLINKEPQQAIQELYDFYVGRNFVNKEYEEKIIEKRVKTLLEKRDLANRFNKQKISDNLYGVTFPFVEKREEKAVRVIKPLFLGQNDSTAIIEHAGHWKLKVEQLRRRRLLHGPILFPVEGPAVKDKDDARLEAFEEVKETLKDADINLALVSEHEKIVDFASH